MFSRVAATSEVAVTLVVNPEFRTTRCVLERDFAATEPNQKWLADMTYVATDEGQLYPALVLALYARTRVGCGLDDERDDATGVDAARWDVASGRRDPAAGLICPRTRTGAGRSQLRLARSQQHTLADRGR